ncbi:MAG: alpha/beta hydrolase [Bacillota bacterium]|nr:alpha/beta hydrolase [Bacillota bacterium]
MKHEETTWLTEDGVNLFAQVWEPDVQKKGVICLVHGLGEHSGRYSHWADLFAGSGYVTISFDLRGHGNSDGQRGDTPSFDRYADDITIMIEQAQNRYPGNPIFIYGHSLGGLLVLYYLVQRHPQLKGAVVTSPGLRTMVNEQKGKVLAAQILGSLVPRVSIANGLDLDGLSRDRSIIEAYKQDPFVHNRISLRAGKEMLKAISCVFENASSIDLPLLIMHGTADRITYAAGSKELASLLPSLCTLKLWDGYFHELHNEPEKEQIFLFLQNWLDNKIKEDVETPPRSY